MHRHCRISLDQGIDDATECPTPIHCSQVAQKCPLTLYRLVLVVRVRVDWCLLLLHGILRFHANNSTSQRRPIASEAWRSSNKTLLSKMAALAQFRLMPEPNRPHCASI
eukprot:5678935-Pleurochrysis_carterae.AAC.1